MPRFLVSAFLLGAACVGPEQFPCEKLQQPLSSYAASDDSTHRVFFDGVTDTRGNLYWLECDAAGCELVSFTLDGVERMRTVAKDVWPAGLPMMFASGRIYVTDAKARPIVLATDTGAEVWRSTAEESAVLEWAADSVGGLWTLERPKGEAKQMLAVSYASDGSVQTKILLTAPASGLVLNAKGEAFFTMRDVISSAATGNVSILTNLVSLDVGGNVRVKAVVQGTGSPVALYDGKVLMRDGQLYSAGDGTKLAASPQQLGVGSPALSPLMGKLVRYRWALAPDEAMFGSQVMFEAYSVEQREATFRLEAGRYAPDEVTASESMLLDDGRALLVSGGKLRALDEWGNESVSCELSSGSTLQGLASEKLMTVERSAGSFVVKWYAAPGLA